MSCIVRFARCLCVLPLEQRSSVPSSAMLCLSGQFSVRLDVQSSARLRSRTAVTDCCSSVLVRAAHNLPCVPLVSYKRLG